MLRGALAVDAMLSAGEMAVADVMLACFLNHYPAENV